MLVMKVIVKILMMKIWVDIAPVSDFVGKEKLVRLPNAAIIPEVKRIAIRPFVPLFFILLFVLIDCLKMAYVDITLVL